MKHQKTKIILSVAAVCILAFSAIATLNDSGKIQKTNAEVKRQEANVVAVEAKDQILDTDPDVIDPNVIELSTTPMAEQEVVTPITQNSSKSTASSTKTEETDDTKSSSTKEKETISTETVEEDATDDGDVSVASEPDHLVIEVKTQSGDTASIKISIDDTIIDVDGKYEAYGEYKKSTIQAVDEIVTHLIGARQQDGTYEIFYTFIVEDPETTTEPTTEETSAEASTEETTTETETEVATEDTTTEETTSDAIEPPIENEVVIDETPVDVTEPTVTVTTEETTYSYNGKTFAAIVITTITDNGVTIVIEREIKLIDYDHVVECQHSVVTPGFPGATYRNIDFDFLNEITNK